VEWVETTGRTVEEAKEAALDQLGVDDQDAEFEILEEPKSGLFGRLRQEARVRARVRPTTPRPKVDRRDRRRRGGGASGAPDTASGPEAAPATAPAPAAPRSRKASARPSTPARPRGGTKPARDTPAPAPANDTGATPMEQLDLDAQAANVQSFLEGLLDAFDVDGDVVVEQVDDDTLEARVDGSDLGLLVGPKGQTLQAVQELARAVLSKEGPGSARLRVDVAGYRERRREALARFTRTVAEQVLASGTATSLEPMGAADRKVVHDTANEIDGVRTISEGEDPRRRVVILPDEA
jgi:spoIIIJ-associated protein